jgi:hypothetical protein
MLWLLGKLEHSEPWSDARKPLARCAVECAAEAEPYEGDGEAGRMAALCRRTVFLWTRGEATRGDVIAARDAAVNAVASDDAFTAAANAADAAAYAADAAAYATDAAYAACAAYTGAAAGNAAAYAARTACATTEHDRILARCADIVRSHYPEPPAFDLVI